MSGDTRVKFLRDQLFSMCRERLNAGMSVSAIAKDLNKSYQSIKLICERINGELS